MDFSLVCLDDDESMPWRTSSSPNGETGTDNTISCSVQESSNSCSSRTTGTTTTPFRAATKACLTCILSFLFISLHLIALPADLNGDERQQRDRHLRCSGLRPCSRCVASNIECVFVASRRGCHGSRRSNIRLRQAHQQRDESYHPEQRQSSPAPRVDTVAADKFALPATETLRVPRQAQSVLLPRPISTTQGLQDCSRSSSGEASIAPDSDILLTAFYYYAFASHPFVLPRNYLCRIEDEALKAVVAAMRWVGSLYLNSHAGPRTELYNEAHRLTHDPETPRNGFLIQAKMLLVVALDGCCEQYKATKMLADVEQLALQIQLHTRDFSTLQGRGMPVMEESWRRTWWDLYVVDGMMAGVRRQSNFPLYDVTADVSLPCEEEEYLSGMIPAPLSLQALDDSGFLENESPLSSFAYRILSGRNLGTMLRLPATCSPTDPAVEKIETLLTSWRLRVPATKQDALHKNGTPDEMMFQACMIHHATSIILHQSFSRLATQPVQAIDACAAPRKSTLHADTVQNVHTVKMNESARAISAMVTYGVPLLSHTHFFTCALTLSSIVHLSHWALPSPTCGHIDDADNSNDEFLREQIRLNMGALEKRATVWSAARQACTQVTSVARDIYQSKREKEGIPPSIWDCFPDDTFFNGQL